MSGREKNEGSKSSVVAEGGLEKLMPPCRCEGSFRRAEGGVELAVVAKVNVGRGARRGSSLKEVREAGKEM